MSVYQVGFITIYVSDLVQALAFYQGKLGMKPLYQDPSRSVALLDNGGATLILQQAEPRSEQVEWVGQNTGISLTVNDLDAQVNILEGRGVNFLHPPRPVFWGKRVAPFLDPDKNILTLVG